MSKISEFRDKQVLLAIQKLNRCTILDLLKYCIIQYPLFDWNYHNIRNSITRLQKENKILYNYDKIYVDYVRPNKIFKQSRDMKVITYNVNYNYMFKDNTVEGGIFGIFTL